MWRLLVVLLMLLPTPAARAATAAEALLEAAAAVHICTEVKDDKLRLACFDKLAPAFDVLTKGETNSTVGTKEITASYAPSDYRPVDAEDLYVAPNKFKGKPIELAGVRCFYADVNEYRCIGRAHDAVVVFAKDVEPEEAKSDLEDRCGAIKQIEAPACRKTIRFVVQDFSEDILSGMAQRLIVVTRQIEIVPRPGRR
ncbi:MAG: hypothetical protein ACLQIQ_07720 [Beijerinckiaceae bacterium]